VIFNGNFDIRYLSATGRTAIMADYVPGCFCMFACLSVCTGNQFCKQDISKTNFWILFAKFVIATDSVHTTLEMINVWCRSHSIWLTLSHFHFNHCQCPPTEGIHTHSTAAAIRLVAPGHISECSSSCDPPPLR